MSLRVSSKIFSLKKSWKILAPLSLALIIGGFVVGCGKSNPAGGVSIDTLLQQSAAGSIQVSDFYFNPNTYPIDLRWDVPVNLQATYTIQACNEQICLNYLTVNCTVSGSCIALDRGTQIFPGSYQPGYNVTLTESLQANNTVKRYSFQDNRFLNGYNGYNFYFGAPTYMTIRINDGLQKNSHN